MLTEAGQKLNWDAWKVDLDGLPGSRMGAHIAKLKGHGTTFTEVTLDWWFKHPEVVEAQAELLKILARR